MLAGQVRFVVLATPRSGSNWLCSLLNSHPAILCHHEIFNPEGVHYALSARGGELDFGSVAQRDREPLQVMERVWTETLGHQVVGFKISRGQSQAVLDAVLEDRGVRKLLLGRNNRIRSFVSERIAEITGEWESYHGLNLSGQEPAIAVEPQALRQHVLDNEHFCRQIHRALEASAQPVLEVCYERLHQPDEIVRVLGWLGVSTEIELQPGTRKQNTTELRRLISNFDELEAQLQGTELAADLRAPESGYRA